MQLLLSYYSQTASCIFVRDSFFELCTLFSGHLFAQVLNLLENYNWRMWVKICSNYFVAIFSYGYLCWNCYFCNLLSFSRMQNSKECCLEYTEISISVFVIVFEWLKDSYFAEIVSLNQSHLGPNRRLRTCYFLEKKKVLCKFEAFVVQKTCGPDCLAGTKLNCSLLL